jgi:hypothetical protein
MVFTCWITKATDPLRIHKKVRYGKVHFALEQAVKTQRKCRVIARLFL